MTKYTKEEKYRTLMQHYFFYFKEKGYIRFFDAMMCAHFGFLLLNEMSGDHCNQCGYVCGHKIAYEFEKATVAEQMENEEVL